MVRPTPAGPRKRSWLTMLVALLATAAQLTVALAPLAEGRESRMASHVEAGGSASHYAHDDTRCVSCQARSMTGAVERQVPTTIPTRFSSVRIGARIEHFVGDARGRLTNPRAPPTTKA